MLFSCCFALSLVHELPLPASAVVGGGGCCWRDVLGPESLLVPWKCQKCQEWSVFRRVWDAEGWASQAWIEDLGLGGKVGAWQRNPYLTGLINDVTVLFFTVYSSVFSILCCSLRPSHHYSPTVRTGTEQVTWKVSKINICFHAYRKKEIWNHTWFLFIQMSLFKILVIAISVVWSSVWNINIAGRQTKSVT